MHTTSVSKGSSGSANGTTRWMAPELLNVEPIYSTGSDIWALGMVYFELSSREVPHSKLSADIQIDLKALSGQSETVPSECEQQAPQLAKIMRHCWSESTLRPAAGEIAEELYMSLGNTSRVVSHAADSDKDTVLDSGYVPHSNI